MYIYTWYMIFRYTHVICLYTYLFISFLLQTREKLESGSPFNSTSWSIKLILVLMLKKDNPLHTRWYWDGKFLWTVLGTCGFFNSFMSCKLQITTQFHSLKNKIWKGKRQKNEVQWPQSASESLADRTSLNVLQHNGNKSTAVTHKQHANTFLSALLKSWKVIIAVVFSHLVLLSDCSVCWWRCVCTLGQALHANAAADLHSKRRLLTARWVPSIWRGHVALRPSDLHHDSVTEWCERGA